MLLTCKGLLGEKVNEKALGKTSTKVQKMGKECELGNR